jgi:uncharacterized protein (TIGR02246 family)
MKTGKTFLVARRFAVATCAAVLLVTTSCNRALPPDTRASDERSIRALDGEWSKAAGAHDLESTLAFYADDAALLPPDEPLAANKAAIRASWAASLNVLETLSWNIRTIEIAKSGDLAYVTGTWAAIAKGPNGTHLPAGGKLVEVWKKQPDGKWKCVVDTYNSDAPPTPAPDPKK